MVYSYRKGVIRVADAYFDTETPFGGDADLIRYLARSKPLEGAVIVPRCTRILDISRPEDEIFGSFSKTVRYEVRRAEQKGQFVMGSLTFDPSPAFLENFIVAYDQFASEHKLRRANRPRLFAMSAAGGLALSSIGSPNQPWVWHAYFRDGALRGSYTRLLWGNALFLNSLRVTLRGQIVFFTGKIFGF